MQTTSHAARLLVRQLFATRSVQKRALWSQVTVETRAFLAMGAVLSCGLSRAIRVGSIYATRGTRQPRNSLDRKEPDRVYSGSIWTRKPRPGP
jgi:hypothetical protein